MCANAKAAPNVFYETSSNTYLYALSDKEFRILILVDLLKIKTIVDQHVTNLSKCSLESVISDI
ncbi:hypothetical protein EYZ11_012381 [Aspergillus tanneri]|uniref:Uncharacterized protein n=1 Tax=Aspergillus tanneri TaxID=1220188 RepID=A0A4S3J0N6_9EURO|nr:hypothetical protein EYZ11_012381 [Aspergillus tanneri]